MPRRRNQSKDNPTAVFVSYQGPHRQTTAATKRAIHQQAMRDIGKTRRKTPKHLNKLIELELPPKPSFSWWWQGPRSVRWTVADDVRLAARFPVELNAYEKMLIANSM